MSRKVVETMPTDIRLDDGNNADWISIEAAVVNARAADLILDSAARRGAGGGPFRRALVHNSEDGLTVNFNGDYPGGVRINGARLNLRVIEQSGPTPKLPRTGQVGDLVLVRNTGSQRINGAVVAEWDRCSLWLCVPSGRVVTATGTAYWQEIQMGEPVAGEA
ncbi:hypothetical protein KBX50_27895 [Micromonospora sp. C51]|uniref:hypothetical protein n=1 Tax=Micromonospora sp. C51 TaxID=2824879 RepID=UPI001B36A701|nr:hypothetical protein [Micromonospora sp. C51]MBQ1052264.1 hypothetical protein [Micromonospora sp. C51]